VTSEATQIIVQPGAVLSFPKTTLSGWVSKTKRGKPTQSEIDEAIAQAGIDALFKK
jgi:hypothetical protein